MDFCCHADGKHLLKCNGEDLRRIWTIFLVKGGFASLLNPCFIHQMHVGESILL